MFLEKVTGIIWERIICDRGGVVIFHKTRLECMYSLSRCVWKPSSVPPRNAQPRQKGPGALGVAAEKDGLSSRANCRTGLNFRDYLIFFILFKGPLRFGTLLFYKFDFS